MKVFIVLSAFVVAASAGHLHGPIAHGPLAAVSTGTSSQFRQEDNYGNYNFGYDEAHATGSTSRREEQTNGVRRGMYSLSDADGRQRVVNYIADAAGFRASIQTNEPGVEPKDPADVLINKAAPVAVAAPLPAPFPAPAPLPAPLPAPIPAPAPVAFGVKGAFRAAPIAVAAPAPLPAPVYEAPAPIAAPVIVEPETPRAFSYSFGATHVAPVAAPAPVYAAPAPLPAPVLAAPAPLPAPLPVPAPAPAGPIFQQRLEY